MTGLSGHLIRVDHIVINEMSLPLVDEGVSKVILHYQNVNKLPSFRSKRGIAFVLMRCLTLFNQISHFA